MLRHDQARVASPEDQALIERLSGDFTDNGFGLREAVSVRLLMEGGPREKRYRYGRLFPNDARWRSFGWKITDGDKQLKADLAWQERHRREDELRRSGLAKLSDDERIALGLSPALEASTLQSKGG
jgi:hypothetical protein